MSRNSSGTMTGINGPYTAGTTISSSAVNARLSDIETEITDSASRSGKGGFSAPVRAANGTVAAPSFSYTSEPGTGHYLAGTGDPRWSVSGVDFVTNNTIAFPGSAGGLVIVKPTAANVGMVVQGNKNAADTGTDILLCPTATRTAGTLVSFHNPLNTPKLNLDYQGLLQLANTAALQPASIWTAITPNANWTAQAGPAYFKDAVGIVRLRGGVIAGAAAANPIATLPAGFRPSATRYFAISDSAGGAAVGFVAGDGTVNMNTAITNGHIYYFDTIAFLAEA